MKRSYKTNGKKKKVKSVGKSSSKYYICCKGKFYMCFSFAHVASSHNIMCSKHFVFFHSLLSCHRTPYFFLIAYTLSYTCCCFFRVLLFICLTVCYYSKISYSFLEVAVSTSHIFFEGLYEWHKFNYQDNQKLVYYFVLSQTHNKNYFLHQSHQKFVISAVFCLIVE